MKRKTPISFYHPAGLLLNSYQFSGSSGIDCEQLEFDPPKVQPTIPDISQPPITPYGPYPTKLNPAYPGHYQVLPMYNTLSLNKGSPQFSDNVKFQTYVQLSLGQQEIDLETKAYIIPNNNPTFDPETYQPIDPYYGVWKKSIFRENQLVKVYQSNYFFAGNLSPLPPKPENPNDWIITFNAGSGCLLLGQKVYYSFFVPGNNDAGGYFYGKVVNISTGQEFDSITLNVISANYVLAGFFITIGSEIINPIILKGQIKNINYNENLQSENLGQITLNIDFYEIENLENNEGGFISFCICAFQMQLLNPNNDSNYTVDSNIAQNKGYDAKLNYSAQYRSASLSFTESCQIGLLYKDSETVIVEDTPDSFHSYVTSNWNLRWQIVEGDYSHKPWSGVTMQTEMKTLKSGSKVTYSYPDPYNPSERVDSVDDINEYKSYYIQKAFNKGDFNPGSPNYDPVQHLCFGIEQDSLQILKSQETKWKYQYLPFFQWDYQTGQYITVYYRMIVESFYVSEDFVNYNEYDSLNWDVEHINRNKAVSPSNYFLPNS